MIVAFLECFRAAWRFRGYRPQPVTVYSVWRWLRQFIDPADKKAVLALLNQVIYVTEAEIEQELVRLNRVLLTRLGEAGIAPKNVIYVQFDTAGSSSGVMLNKLRDGSRLEHLGCPLLHSVDVKTIHETTNALGSGAIVYVDDFSGTGTQFIDSLRFVRKYIVGTFTEFLLVHTICEEAMLELGKAGIEPLSAHVHTKVARPLHRNSNVLTEDTVERLRGLTNRITPVQGFGFQGVASMVVFYSGAPDTVPMILRGSPGQHPFRGILPRFADLPDPVPVRVKGS